MLPHLSSIVPASRTLLTHVVCHRIPLFTSYAGPALSFSHSCALKLLSILSCSSSKMLINACSRVFPASFVSTSCSIASLKARSSIDILPSITGMNLHSHAGGRLLLLLPESQGQGVRTSCSTAGQEQESFGKTREAAQLSAVSGAIQDLKADKGTAQHGRHITKGGSGITDTLCCMSSATGHHLHE